MKVFKFHIMSFTKSDMGPFICLCSKRNILQTYTIYVERNFNENIAKNFILCSRLEELRHDSFMHILGVTQSKTFTIY